MILVPSIEKIAAIAEYPPWTHSVPVFSSFALQHVWESGHGGASFPLYLHIPLILLLSRLLFSATRGKRPWRSAPLGLKKFQPSIAPFFFVDCKVLYGTCGYLSKRSWTSINSTPPNSLPANSVLIAVGCAGSLPIAASQFCLQIDCIRLVLGL